LGKNTSEAPKDTNKENRRTMKRQITIMLLCAAMALAMVSCGVETPEKKASSGQDANMENGWGGQVALANSPADCGYGGGWGCHISESETDIIFISDAGIVRRAKHGLEQRLIVPNVEGSRIDTMEINGDRIYYGAFFKNLHTSKVFSANLDGGAVELLFDGALYEDFEWRELDPPSWGLKFIDGLHYSNGRLYINSTTSSFVYDIQAKAISGFVSDINSAGFLGDRFYYVNHAEKTFSIYEKNLSTGKTELVRGDGVGKRHSVIHNGDTPWFDRVYVIDGKMYYTTRMPAQLYQYSPGGEDILIADFSENSKPNIFEVAAGRQKLYYVFGTDAYEYDLQSGATTKLATIKDMVTDGYSGFCVADGVLMYRGKNNEVKRIRLNNGNNIGGD
jgi:hypothetical protein